MESNIDLCTKSLWARNLLKKKKTNMACMIMDLNLDPRMPLQLNILNEKCP